MKIIDIYAVETEGKFELVDGPMRATHIARHVIGYTGAVLFMTAFVRLGDYEARGAEAIEMHQWLAENDPNYDPASFRL